MNCPYSSLNSTNKISGVLSTQNIVMEEKPKLDFSHDMSYGDYLDLDTLLSAQKMKSNIHDEMLFIIQHHVSELWLKLMLHEFTSAKELISEDNLGPAFKMLARVSRIFENLIKSWDVLMTMTPVDYTALRPYLGNSSGFQSYQYRHIEFCLGNKNDAMLEPFKHRSDLFDQLYKTYSSPSMYDLVLQLLSLRGFPIPESHTMRDWRGSYTADQTVQDSWLTIYRNTDKYWDLYKLAEVLVDIENAFRLWRFRHVTTVERVIGYKRGSGGTSGVTYLRKMLDVVMFPELWELRTHL